MLYQEMNTRWIRVNFPKLATSANLLVRTKYGTAQWHERASGLAVLVAQAIIDAEIIIDEAWVQSAIDWSWDHDYRSAMLSGYVARELKAQFKLRGWNF